jgi:hypothetical protein
MRKKRVRYYFKVPRLFRGPSRNPRRESTRDLKLCSDSDRFYCCHILKSLLIQDISYTSIDIQHLNMGIYTLSVQSIVIFLVCLGFIIYKWVYFMRKQKNTNKYKTDWKYYDWLYWKCVDTYFEVSSFDWCWWNRIIKDFKFRILDTTWVSWDSHCVIIILFQITTKKKIKIA